MTSITAAAIQPEFALVLLELSFLVLMVFFSGRPQVVRRQKYFTKDFFEKNFPELKGRYPDLGHPDCGNGRFSDKLTLEQWMDFNNAQRVHLNFVEHATPAMFALYIAGLFQPRLAALLGAVYIVGRAVYMQGYLSQGPRGRFAGLLLFLLAFLGLAITAIVATFQAAGGVAGLVQFGANVASFNLWV